MFQLINPSYQKVIVKLAEKGREVSAAEMVMDMENLIEQIRAGIPEKRRFSYGHYSIIKQLGRILSPMLEETGVVWLILPLKYLRIRNMISLLDAWQSS